MVTFWIVVTASGKEERRLLSPDVPRNMPLMALVRELQARSTLYQEYLGGADESLLLFYKIPSLRAREESQSIYATAMASSEAVAGWDEVQDLAEVSQLNYHFICLRIECQPKSRLEHPSALEELEADPLFASLQITLRDMRTWSHLDVEDNQLRGWWRRNGEPPNVYDPVGVFMMELEAQLSKRRTYSFMASEGDYSRRLDLVSAGRFGELFGRYFEPESVSCGLVTSRELAAVYHLLDTQAADVGQAVNHDASAAKGEHFSGYFFSPPFVSVMPPGMHSSLELQFKFPILLSNHPSTQNQPQLRTFTPVNDYGVAVGDSNPSCPLLLCEVVSNPAETDRWRLLLEAIVAARVLCQLTHKDAQQKPFVVALYVTAGLVVERYILTTGTGDCSMKVFIAQKNFMLTRPADALDCLRELYNLRDLLSVLVEQLDASAKGRLMDIQTLSKQLPSHNEETRTGTTQEQPQGTHGNEIKVDYETVFTERADVQQCLDEIGYGVAEALSDFEHVAWIHCKSDVSACGFLKLTERKSEVEILQYLSKFDTPDNHTIRGAKVWDLKPSEEFLIFTPSAGTHLDTIRHPDDHLWSSSRQLLEGINFMHKHGVAHLDIKPANILIPRSGGRLSIIDFSIAVFAKDRMFHAKNGTKGYMAPEVVKGIEYDAIRADLWSCGKTLEVMCALCRGSERVTFIQALSKALTSSNPAERPMMSQVITQMDAFDSNTQVTHKDRIDCQYGR